MVSFVSKTAWCFKPALISKGLRRLDRSAIDARTLILRRANSALHAVTVDLKAQYLARCSHGRIVRGRVPEPAVCEHSGVLYSLKSHEVDLRFVDRVVAAATR